MSESKVIEIEHLSKSFGNLKAVDDLTFSVREGELFAFLGENGAGKSTTITMMCGGLTPDSGSIKICGIDVKKCPQEIARKIGVVFQSSALDSALSVKDNLRSRASLYGITGDEFEKRLSELCKLLDFENLLPKTLGKLSGGQRRRIDIARALLHSPEILILDEPTTGLDPQTRKLLWDVVKTLRHTQKMTVLLTTHYMEEAADADYVLIIDGGKHSASGTPHELKNRYSGDFVTIYSPDEETVKNFGYPYEVLRDALRIAVPDTAAAKELIVKYPDVFTDFEITKGKMDDVFLAVTGKKLSGGGEK